MENLIVDANIVFSGILNTNSKIADILLNSDKIKIIAPNFLRIEIKKYHNKIAKYLKVSIEEVQEIEFHLTKNITFIAEEIIPLNFWINAENLTKDVDVNDTPYIAYSLFYNYKIWTGDKKLIKGLKNKNFQNTISTTDLHKKLFL
jgi:predicted nucleic acid-binding protein